MSTIGFARAAQRWTSRICVHDLFTFQGVTPSSKTRNQLIQCTTSWPAHRVAHPKAVRQESREMLGIMPPPASHPPQGPYPDTSA